MQVKDKVVIITGASEGIGLETARKFAAEGAKLVIAARSADKLETLASELRQNGADVLVVPTDLRDEAQVKGLIAAAVQHYGNVDVLINNAGQSSIGRVESFSIDQWKQIIELNLVSVVNAMQAVIPSMREHGGGMIVNVTSMVSKMRIPGISAYAATKSALNTLTLTARDELANDNIRVCLVYPRLTTTNFGRNALGDQAIRATMLQGQGNRPGVVSDSAEHVANKILECVVNETAEQFME